jgi:hypothetical protein
VLARYLQEVLDQPWGQQTSDESETARRDFVESASQFMRPHTHNLPAQIQTGQTPTGQQTQRLAHRTKIK